jgi:hypothetical protein
MEWLSFLVGGDLVAGKHAQLEIIPQEAGYGS